MGNNYLNVSRVITDERVKDDYYATSPEAAEWLLRIEQLDPNIWECACGEGFLSEVFKRNGHTVKSTDLIDRGYGEGGIDFFDVKDVFDGDIITNPPYKCAQAFVEHALELVPDGRKVCMFLKIQFLEGRKRKALFEKNPPKRVWVSSSRIKCGSNGKFKETSSMMAYAWYIWEKGYKGETILKWFN